MGTRQRVPGEFSRTNMGRALHSHTGWQRFRFTDAGVVTEEPTDVLDGAPVETTGNTVVTFKTSHSLNSEHPIDGYVGAIPLKTPEGTPLKFGDPFSLKVMIELISISGTYTGSTSTTASKPQVCMGIGMNASDFDSDSNRHFVYGWRNNAGGSEDIDEDGRWIYSSLASGGSGQVTTNNGAGDDSVLFIGQFFVGPDMTDGSGGAEAHNAHLVRQEFADSNHTTPYSPGEAATGGSNMTAASLNQNQGFNDGAAPVYLYACISDKNHLSGTASSACVVTCRLWYMVEADILGGWGTQ